MASISKFLDRASKGVVHMARGAERSFDSLVNGAAKAQDFDVYSLANIDDLGLKGKDIEYMEMSGELYDLLDDKLGKMGLTYDVNGRDIVIGKSSSDVSRLKNAQSPVDYGKSYGYSDDDIAAFYMRRAGGNPELAYKQYVNDAGSIAEPKGLLDWVGRSVSELVDMGYPESVAKRISSGELPMDYASRMARASEQGYDPRTYYHGGDPSIFELDPTKASDPKTAGTGTWFAEQPEISNSYLKPDNMLYPVRIKTEGMDKLDAGGDVWNRVQGPRITRDGEVLSYDGFPYFNAGDVESVDDLARLSAQTGGKGLVIDNLVDIGPNYRMPRETKDDWIGWLLDYEQKGGRNVSVQDPTALRSLLSAAFDPEYTGSNILGSRMAPTAGAGLLGTAALTGSNEASALEQLRASEREFGMSDIDKLRASEREFRAPTPTSEAYGRANAYFDEQRKGAAESGATLAEWMMPDFTYSQQKAEGDKSLSTGLFAMLEKLDPSGYIGLLDALRSR